MVICDRAGGSDAACGGNLRVALDNRNYVAAGQLGDLHEHQPDRAGADDGNRVADLHLGFVQTAQHAGQRLDHGSFFEAHVLGDGQHVGFNDAARDANVFGISAVVEQQIFAKIFLVLGAVEACAAGRRVERHHAHSLAESPDVGPNFLDHTGQFMSKQCRRHDHARVISPLINLEVGAACQRNLHLDQDFAFVQFGDRHLLDLDVLFAIEDRRGHLSVHSTGPSIGCPVESRLSWSRVGDGQQNATPLRILPAENDG